MVFYNIMLTLNDRSSLHGHAWPCSNCNLSWISLVLLVVADMDERDCPATKPQTTERHLITVSNVPLTSFTLAGLITLLFVGVYMVPLHDHLNKIL